MPMSTKRKAPAKLAAPVVKSSAKPATKNVIDESRTAISNTDVMQSSIPETIEISSDANSDEDMSDEDDEDEMEVEQEEEDVAQPTKSLSAPKNGLNPADNSEDAEEDGPDGESTLPSFGELLRGNEAIDVPALLQHPSNASGAVTKSGRAVIAPPALQSLGTVLTQALRTDDTDLLESCLHTKDLTTIRNTIERLDSNLAGTLLTKLAARLYRRPGRAGVLMTWVQWTLVAHGGALATQPKVIHGLHGLQKVLAERAKGLNSLLALKGKLDLLEGQMDLRRKMQRASANQQVTDEDEEDVIWVEGDDLREKAAANGPRSKRNIEHDEDEEIPTANGFIDDSDDDEEDEDVEDDSEAAEESLDEDEVDHDDVDESMAEEDESDVDAAPPTKVQKTAKSFGKRK